MADHIEEIKKKISVLNHDEKVYRGIDLTYEQQVYERGKPKGYLELTLELFKAINGTRIVGIGCMRIPLVHSISQLNPSCCNEGHSTIFWCLSGADVVSIDINKHAVKTAKKSCKKYKNCKIIRGDGNRYLEKYKKKSTCSILMDGT